MASGAAPDLVAEGWEFESLLRQLLRALGELDLLPRPFKGAGADALAAVAALPPFWWEASELADALCHLVQPAATGSPATEASWQHLKEEGNVAFRTGQFGDAIAHYSASLSALDASTEPSVVKLLCNRALASLRTGGADLDALVGAILAPWHCSHST